MRHVLALSLTSLPLALLAACASTPPAETCILDSLAAQPTERFPSGHTYYLPTLSTEGGCESLAWTLLEAPSVNTNVVVREGGQSRFTPIETGRYVFAAGEARRTLEVIDGRSVPFEDYAYYPSRSQVGVGDEIWIANAFVATLTRVSADGTRNGEIVVGPSPVAVAHEEGAPYVVVAQRASDTLGLVDAETGVLVDAIHVGDEPANVVLSPDGTRAYVALATEDAVAVVDLAARRVEARIEAVVDPLGLAISRDGARLFVASHRSGQAQRFPFEDDPTSEERDLAVIDTSTRSVTATWLEVGSTIGALAMSDDDATLYVATLRNDTESPLGTEGNVAFQHVIAAYDAASGAERTSADLSRQPSSTGPVVTLHQPTLAEGLLWVVAEGSDRLLGLDPTTLEERRRVEVPGRPRHVLAHEGTLFVHGVQDLSVTRVAATSGDVLGTTQLAEDPRSQDVARGQRYFTGAGRDFAVTWSCNSCHADARGDTLVWNAGPLEGHALSRPFFWLEGTAPLGWAGYLSNVRNYAYTVNINVGVRPTTEEALDLTAYLSGLLPPPAGGATTRLDGSLSEAALRGREVFETRGGCVGCHAGELSTNRASFPMGITAGVSDVPSLVGAYRHNTWMKRGEARSLEDALDLVLESTSISLAGGDRSDLLAYLRELQARDFFVLASSPENGQTRVAVDAPIRLTFSAAIWDDPSSTSAITLHDAMGAEVEAELVVEADRRHVRIEPSAPLAFAARYEVRLAEGIASFDARELGGMRTFAFTTARAPSVRLEGRYVWTVDLPALDFANRRFDPTVTTPMPIEVQASPTPSGARAVIDYGRSLTLETDFVIDGDRLVLPSLPVPIGPSFADTRGAIIDLVDDGGEGRAEFGEGGVSMTGPGFVVDDVGFRLEHESALTGCPEGASGAVAITLGTDAMGRTTFSWDTAEHGEALGFYVTAPRATIPAGPGQVVMGRAYWVVATEAFPMGFASPVTYGAVPSGAQDDGETHMASFEEIAPGGCYKAAVATTRFRTGEIVFRVPE